MQWVYRAERWSPEQGSRKIDDSYIETVQILVDENQKAYGVAREKMREKINASDLPERPETNTISLSLISLVDSSGKPVGFDREKSFLERPVFRDVSLMSD